MNIVEFLKWRKEFLANPEGAILQSTRGECTVGPFFVIEDEVQTNWHMKNRDIEEAEFNLIFFGLDQPEKVKERLYANDEKLYQAYKSLNISSLINMRRDSRKNIIFNKECCLCYWQVWRDTLIVVSRSWDIQRAGLSDLVIINRVAGELKCKNIRVMALNNHVYTDRDVIARRKTD